MFGSIEYPSFWILARQHLVIKCHVVLIAMAGASEDLTSYLLGYDRTWLFEFALTGGIPATYQAEEHVMNVRKQVKPTTLKLDYSAWRDDFIVSKCLSMF
jgi:hypothetical protein